MEDKYKELIYGSGGLRWQITSFNQQCRVRKTNDVYTDAVSRPKNSSIGSISLPVCLGLYELQR